jgi:plastocyanin
MRRLIGVALGVVVAGAVTAALPSAARAATPTVDIRAGAACPGTPYCISAASVTVPAGSTVVWRNLADLPLRISRCSVATCPGLGPGTGPEALPQSPPLGARAVFMHSFQLPGTYNYTCVVGGLAVLLGTVTVGQAGPAPQTAQGVPLGAAAAPSTGPPPAPPAPSTAQPPAPPAPGAAPHAVAIPGTGAEPPWALGVMLTVAGAVLLAAGRGRWGEQHPG